MLKFSSEKDGHTLLSHQSCPTQCLVCLVFLTVAANWLRHAEQSVYVPKGTSWWSEGILQGTRRKVSLEKRSLGVNWSPAYFLCLLYLLTSPLHSIHFRGDMTMPNAYLWHEHCVMLRNCWPLTATVPHSHPVLSEFKHRLQWAVCQVHKHGNELCIYLTTFELSNLASVLPNLY